MPSKSVLEQKQAYVADLAEKLKNAAGGVLVDYKGISVEADTKLRKDLRENGVEYFVVKNTLLKRAAEIAGIEVLSPLSPAQLLSLFPLRTSSLPPSSCSSRPRLLTAHSLSSSASSTARLFLRKKLKLTQSFRPRRPCSLSSYSCFSLRFRELLSHSTRSQRRTKSSPLNCGAACDLLRTA